MMKGGHSQSTAMAEILNPTNGFRGSLKAKGIKPKNHMAANRQFLRKQEQIVKDQKDEMNNTKTERFVMKRFQNVDSKVQTTRPGTETSKPANGFVRPPRHSVGQEDGKENAKPPINGHVAFGKITRNESASGLQQNRPNSARSQLTSQNLSRFDRKSNSIGAKKPVDPEVVVFTGEEAKLVAAKAAQNPEQTPIHKNYGKVPKYLNKYKEEAADLERQRAELRAKKMLPPGMKQMDEAERIQTLEQLESTRRELNTVLQSMPISMRSDNLKMKKRELEERLAQVERGIATFSRKVVYIQE